MFISVSQYIYEMLWFINDHIEENSYANDEEIAKILNTYLTVDETNGDLDILKGRIETFEAENTSLKTTMAVFEARIAALEEKNELVNPNLIECWFITGSVNVGKL